MYKLLIKKSAMNLKNLILFLPDIIYFILVMIFTLIFLQSAGILDYIINNANVYDFIQNYVPYFKENLFKILMYLGLLFIAVFFAGASLDAIKYAMISDLIKEKKVSIKNWLVYSRKYTWRVIGLRFIMFLIAIIILIATSVLLTLLLTGIDPIYRFIAIVAVTIIIMLVLKLIFIFRYAVLFIDDSSVRTAFKRSFNFFKKNIRHVAIIIGIIVLINIVFGIITMPIDNGIKFLENSLKSYSIIIALVITVFLRFLLSVIINLWNNLFLFYSYKKG